MNERKLYLVLIECNILNIQVFMKKYIILLLFPIIGILSSCDGIQGLHTDKDKQVVSIELIRYDNSLVIDNPLGSYMYDSNLVIIVEEIDQDIIETFIEALNEIGDPIAPLYKTYVDSHNGIGVRILYEDSSFTLMTLTEVSESIYPEVIFVADYSSELDVTKSYNVFSDIIIKDFKELLNTYFDNKIN